MPASDSPVICKKEKPKCYDSPSRLSAETPIKTALRSSNNDVYVFLDKLEKLNKFKKGIEKLKILKARELGDENEAPGL